MDGHRALRLMGGVMKRLIPPILFLNSLFQPRSFRHSVTCTTCPPQSDCIIPWEDGRVFLKKLTNCLGRTIEVPQNSLAHFTILVVLWQGSSQSPDLILSLKKSYNGLSTVCFFCDWLLSYDVSYCFQISSTLWHVSVVHFPGQITFHH